MQHPTPLRFTGLLGLSLLLVPQLANARVITTYDRNGRMNYCPSKDSEKVRIRASNGVGDNIHPAALEVLSCVVKGFEQIGLPIKTIWGYGCRAPLGRSGGVSNHPKGLAIDIDQYARDRTRPEVPRQQGIRIAQSCNAVSGAIWRNPDNGHFELRSLPRNARPANPAPPPPKVSYPPKKQQPRYPQGYRQPYRAQPRFYFPIFGWIYW